MGNFDFAHERWPTIWDAARRAEEHLKGDPRASATYARRAAELFTHYIYDIESLTRPYDDRFAVLIDERDFIDIVSPATRGKIDIVRRIGNRAVHRDDTITVAQARQAVEHLHEVLRWLDYTYGDPAATDPPRFDFALVPPAPAGVIARARADLERLQAENEAKDRELHAALGEDERLRAELEALRAELAAVKAANAAEHERTATISPTIATEAETRRDLIDLSLAEAGWPLDATRDREWPVTGIPSPSGNGYVDYVLWGDDGKPLAVVEAKRTTKDAGEGRQQALLYADALERDTGQRPLIFYTNGFETWLWDDRRYPPRRVAGFLTKDQLALAIQRRTSLKSLASVPINRAIVERPYQLRAIRSVSDALESGRRRALLVMATGTGKTRTVIALADVLQRANWVKRVLFLADRTALVNQAVGAFKTHLPDSAPVNLVSEKDAEGRVFVSTYQTVMGLIDAGEDELRRFGPGYFDLIVVDEAHRSIYHRYGEIFDYFDALLVGLTATPRAEVDHNTYRLFGLDDGVPTDAFELDDAIAGGYLVPPVARPIDLGFIRRGIRYADLSAAEREQWDELEWQDGEIPNEVDAAAMNRWLFNADTVDKVLEVLMTEGRTVAGGDRLGKTIVFAKNQQHADFIERRFDANYPERAGSFARTITHASGPYAQSLIDDFSLPEKPPHIAISVDMLDTGIDVPDVVNLVFFKPVHSQTKYWQMVGRGTRLRPDLYGPGEDKEDFIIFDVCGNIEYFNQQLPPVTSPSTRSVGARTFEQRVELLAQLSRTGDASALRAMLADHLHGYVAGMNRSNFLVRSRLRVVERFAEPDVWHGALSDVDVDELTQLAGLPSAVGTEPDELAARFDLLLVTAQNAVARRDLVPASVAEAIITLARALRDERGIPAVAAQAWLIDAIIEPEWWDGVDLDALEDVRLRLRGLVRLVDAAPRAIVYTDFEDTLDPRRDVTIERVSVGLDRVAFRQRLYAFLREHAHNVALHKLRTGRQLTADDLTELERILTETGGLDPDQLDRDAEEARGLGRLIRSIVGMERSAAEELVADFVAVPGFTAQQHAFVDLVIEQLTIGGELDPRRLYEDPFSGLAPDGPEGLFTEAQITDLMDRLRHLDATAAPDRTTA